MYLSAAENFTLPQAVMADEASAGECIKRLNENPFIRRDAKADLHPAQPAARLP
ncbi:MAG: hypothetical protein ACLUEQ_10365 [Cloacibacillus evryensis]